MVDASSVEVDGHGVTPDRAVPGKVLLCDHEPVHAEERLRDRAAVDARGALLGKCFQRLHHPRLYEELARLQQPIVADE